MGGIELVAPDAEDVVALPHVTLLPVASREMLPAEVDRLNIHKDERGCRGPQAPAFGLGGKM